MKILVLGASGFLGSHLYNYLKNAGHQLSIIERGWWKDHDLLSCKGSKLRSLFLENEVVINCIAETDFKKCDHLLGIEANVGIPAKISTLISQSSIYCIHISTDAFYEAISNNSNENSQIRLNNHYAKQKHDAERVLERTNSIVLRTSFIGKNPRKIGMIDYLIDSIRQEKKIVGWNDVFTSSVHVNDVARLIEILVYHQQRGVFNFGTDQCYSKFQLLEGIMQNFNNTFKVSSINAPLDHETRNFNCGMSSSKILSSLELSLPTFEDVVQQCYLDVKKFL